MIKGFAMCSSDMISLHDVYEELHKDEKTQYILQFLWRDLSSDFDIIGPYFNCSSSLEVKSLHSFVIRSMLVFVQFGFGVRALLCDGASTNLKLLKLLCASGNAEDDDIIQTSFQSPLDGRQTHVIVCPSHQVYIDTV